MGAQTVWNAPGVKERLTSLASSHEHDHVFGANGHHFLVGRPLSSQQVKGFETEWGFQLPGDYRLFLTAVGNGGAGPGYGLFPLGMADDIGDDMKPWDDFLVGRPGSQFPHERAWNLPLDQLQPPDELGQEQLDAWFEHHDTEYFDPRLVDGAIPIAHFGCAIRIYLVVTGPLAGQVWTDDRAGDQGIYPCEPVQFTHWYLRWLEEAERHLGADS